MENNVWNQDGGRRSKGIAGAFVIVVAVATLAAACGGSKTTSSEPVASASSDSNSSSGQSTTVPSKSSGPSTSPAIWQSAPYAPPNGDAGKLSVVAVGSPDSNTFGASVPVIVRNNTADAMTDIEASGTVRNAAGSLVSSGSSQGFAPETIQPGEWAYGFVYFSVPLPADSVVTVTATGEKASGRFAIFPYVILNIQEVAISTQRKNLVVIGIVSNPDSKETVDPAKVSILCTSTEGMPLSVESEYSDGPVLPNGTSSFSADLYDKADSCPVVSVTSGGYGD